MLAQHFVGVVDALKAGRFHFGGREVAAEVVEVDAGQQFHRFAGRFDRPCDDVDTLLNLLFQDLAGDGASRFGALLRLDFDDQPHVGQPFQLLEVLSESGDFLAVGQRHAQNLLGGTLLHFDTLVCAVVVDDQLAVDGHPDVAFGAEDADRIGLAQRCERVLGRAVGFPETAVRDDFGLCRRRQREGYRSDQYEEGLGSGHGEAYFRIGIIAAGTVRSRAPRYSPKLRR